MKVLVVEDTAANMALATYILENAGHAVVQADNATAGIAAARAARPDVILMDIQMPGIDGLAATRALKADPATSALPVIALTSYAMRGDKERMLAAGCDGYLAKPYTYDELLAAIREFA